MKTQSICRGLMVLLVLTGGLIVAQEKEKEKKAPKEKKGAQPLILFKPRNVGAPSFRVGKATRGGKPDLVLCTITPASSALSFDPTPTLYWYQSDKSEGNLKIIVSDPQSFKTLLEKTIKVPKSKGIHGFVMATQGVRLAPGREYEWTVTYVIDNRRPSANATAVGRIAVLEADAAVKEALADAGDGAERAKVFAAHGIWYDAFDEISRMVEANPERSDLKTLRDSLIRQAGLADVIK